MTLNRDFVTKKKKRLAVTKNGGGRRNNGELVSCLLCYLHPTQRKNKHLGEACFKGVQALPPPCGDEVVWEDGPLQPVQRAPQHMERVKINITSRKQQKNATTINKQRKGWSTLQPYLSSRWTMWTPCY